MKQFNNLTIEKYKNRRGVTLIELIIAITLIGVVVLGFASIDIFSRHHVLTSDRRSKIQNEVSFVLEHMTKNISQAIGDVNQPPVVITSIGVDPLIRVWVDGNPFAGIVPNGRRDPYPDDHEIAYRYKDSDPDRYQIWYYAVCRGLNCNQAGSTAPEVIARSISGYDYNVTDNYVYVELIGCWDPNEIHYNCGTSDNPTFTIRTRIMMPSVSTH